MPLSIVIAKGFHFYITLSCLLWQAQYVCKVRPKCKEIHELQVSNGTYSLSEQSKDLQEIRVRNIWFLSPLVPSKREKNSLSHFVYFLRAEPSMFTFTKYFLTRGDKNQIFRTPETCSELKKTGLNKSVTAMINPAGLEQMFSAMEVRCDLPEDKTYLGKETKIEVVNCDTLGCYNQSIDYNTSNEQIEALISSSTSCRQVIKLECVLAPIVDLVSIALLT